ncbi:MAG: fasciclin domain-containing protein [Planctomycetota bacterium]|jgi:uncharacterized surface protein with fasciclin (FAS1) repeats
MLQNSKMVALLGAFSIAMLAASPTMAQCGKKAQTVGSRNTAAQDIVETAIGAGSFETLVTAVKAAGLVDTLRSPGPFTVFAPTDEAFAQLPKETIKALLADPDRLGAILKFHVVPGRLMAADVQSVIAARTALGQAISVDTSNGIQIGGANILKADIETSNGVIHVIDKVLIPANDVVETARGAGSFKTLLAALEAADLTGALRGEGPFTVFAPTDEAFAKLPKGTVEALLNDIPMLKSVLTYHVVAGKVLASDVVRLSQAKTLQGQDVRIDTSSGVRINESRVVKTDVFADNGVIHVIDSVLLPPSMGQTARPMNAEELIGQAIERGVPLFNDGQPSACTAVYEVAAMGLIANDNNGLHTSDRKRLLKALGESQREHDATRSAWIMRNALDAVYASITH